MSMSYHTEVFTADFRRQEELEEKGAQLGREKFEGRVLRDSRNVGGGRALLKEAMARVGFLLREWDEGEGNRRGPTPFALKWVRKVGVEIAAFIACREAFQVLAGPLDTTEVVRKIAQGLVDERRAQVLKEKAPYLFAYKQQQFQTTNYAHMARSIGVALHRLTCQDCYKAGLRDCGHMGDLDADMTQAQRLAVGSALLKVVQECYPEVIISEAKTVKVRGKYRKKNVLSLSEEAQEFIAERNGLLGDLVPVCYPMVVPPLPWSPEGPGGYRFSLLGRYDFVRGSSRQQARVAEEAGPVVYDSVNRIQETPYRVHKRVLEVVKQIAEVGLGRETLGVPQLVPHEAPAGLGENPSPEEVKEYRTRAAEVHGLEAARIPQAASFLTLLAVADEVADEQAIWFPWNLDFRGRAYPIPHHLQPQGSDLSKGLLSFADGVELGESGAYWLAVHLANCLDDHKGLKLTKLTLEERVQWVENHSEEIREVALEPLAHAWWLDADSPWEFLAACFEWARYMEEGNSMISHLPVAIDGSCNGLQHMAAMLRDGTGAQAVNVTANDRPEDVYQRTTDWVLDRLQVEAADNPLAQGWIASGLVDRKLCKRPTMTFGYGGTVYGFGDQIQDHILGLLGKEAWVALQREWFWDAETEKPTGTKAIHYLARLIASGLGAIVPGAVAVRDWMQASARLVAKSNHAVHWTVPLTGFPVQQDSPSYFISRTKRVDTVLGGGIRYQPKYDVKTSKVNGSKQANAVSPNFVHSLDAAAMMLTVQDASSAGIGSFAMVHDSFGTHAGHMGVLRDATRRAFFRLYSRRDVAQEFYQELLNQIDDLAALPEPPAMGDLDVSVVLVSDYFFA